MSVATSLDLENQALRLTELVMRAGRPILAEQPLAFDPSFDGRRLVIERDGKVVSSLAILTRTLLLSDERVPVGLIGSVVTDPDYRGLGLASDLLSRAENELRGQGALLAMLWADEEAFYRARGYTSVGTELDYRITRGFRAWLPLTSGVRPAVPQDVARMHELYCEQAERVDRNPRETRALILGPGIRALVHETGGEIDAYALEGRGEDLGGVIHEWAGSLFAVLACIAAQLDHLGPQDDGLWCLVPANQFEMQAALNAMEVPGVLGVLGMAKLLDLPLAADWFNRVTPTQVRAEVDGEVVQVHGAGGEILLNQEQLLSALIPPKAKREIVASIENQLGVELPNLPQQPFLWGLDSI